MSPTMTDTIMGEETETATTGGAMIATAIMMAVATVPIEMTDITEAAYEIGRRLASA